MSFRKILFTSNYLMSQFLEIDTINTIRMIATLTIWLKVSLKSIDPSVQQNMLAANLALSLPTLPLGSSFSLNTYMFPTILHYGKVQGPKYDFGSRHQILHLLSSSILERLKHFVRKLVYYQFKGYQVVILKSSNGWLHKLLV